MSKATWINVNGVWKNVKNVWENVNGIWKEKVIPKGNINGVWKEFIAYVTLILNTINLPSSTVKNRTYSLVVNNLDSVVSVTVDTGQVTYTISGNTINLTTDNGNIINTLYNSTKYSKTATGYSTNTSNSFSVTYNYNDGSYVGTLTKNGVSYVISGSYTPQDSKTATDSRSTVVGGSAGSLPSSVGYNVGGYSGTLIKSGSATVISGSYTPPDSMTFDYNNYYDGPYIYTVTKYRLSGCSYTYYGDLSMSSFPSSVYYNSGGYVGSLSLVDYNWTNWVWAMHYHDNQYDVKTFHDRAHAYGMYVGTVTKPAVDTRIWQQNYSGIVTKPAVDTRVYRQDYSGTAYMGGYDNYYAYNITLNYNIKNQ